jgi:hypothetical protein
MEPYVINVVVGQRKVTYPGEYAPEVLEAMDEYGCDENPEWLEAQAKKHRDSDEFSAVAIIALEVNRADIEKALTPAVIKASVLPRPPP